MKTVLIVGATRGLGASLAHQYASLPHHRVYATARYHAPTTNPYLHSLTYIPNIDITHENTARLISLQWAESTGTKLDLLIVCASYFSAETLSTLNMDKQVQMYKTVSIGPIFLVKGLVEAGLLGNGSSVVLVGSEMGSIGLRHESELGLGGGGNYGGCGSKAALHMGGRLLSMDLKKLGVAVGIVHTGYLRVEKEGGIWEGGEGEKGAVKPDEAASALRAWIDTFDMSKTGQLWSVRGPAGIKTAGAVLGPIDTLPTPLQLPW